MTAVPNSPPARWVNRHLPRAPPRQPGGTPRRARVPPVDYRDGLLPYLIYERSRCHMRLT